MRHRLLPPPSIALALAMSALLPIFFAAIGKLWPGESVLLQIAKSAVPCTALWVAAVKHLHIRVDLSEAIACTCILAIALIGLYIAVSLLAYSFRLEALQTVGRSTHGLAFADVAATFGNGAGLGALSGGRIRTLELLGMISRTGDTVEITSLGQFVADLYGTVRGIAHLE